MAIKDLTEYVESLSENEVQKFMTALNYEIGFSGVGPTALDREPEEPLSEELKERFAEIIAQEKEFRRNNFRAAMIMEIGEIDGHYATKEEVAWAEEFVESLTKNDGEDTDE